MTKCEVFACPNKGSRMYQMAPGTNVWLCDECKEDMEKPVERKIETPRIPK